VDDPYDRGQMLSGDGCTDIAHGQLCRDQDDAQTGDGKHMPASAPQRRSVRREIRCSPERGILDCVRRPELRSWRSGRLFM
jgi:hypothetical protein